MHLILAGLGATGLFVLVFNLIQALYEPDIENRDFIEANILFECNSCNKLFRQYQIDLYKEKHDKKCCPHCQKEIEDDLIWSLYAMNELQDKINSHTKVKAIYDEDTWMSTHPDCPKLTHIKQLKEIRNVIKTIKKNRDEQQEFNRFMEYNKLEVDSQWINNLNKTEKEKT